jgi:phage shock protein E
LRRLYLAFAALAISACGDAQPQHDPAPGAPAIPSTPRVEATGPATGSGGDASGADPAAPAEGALRDRRGAAEARAEGGEHRRVVYIDVRRPDEWAEGRVTGAIHIPYTDLPARLAELEPYRDADIVLYCRTGRRSGIAEEILRSAGFERLDNGGGLSDLIRKGVPVER